MAGKALVLAKAAKGGAKASTKAAKKKRLAGVREGRSVYSHNVYQTELHGHYQKEPIEDFNPRTGEWRYTGRSQAKMDYPNKLKKATTVKGKTLTYSGRTHERTVLAVGSKRTNVKDQPVRRSVGIGHNRYNFKSMKGTETTYDLRPNLLGGWGGGSSRSLKHVSGHDVMVKTKHYAPVNPLNGLLGAYAGLVGWSLHYSYTHAGKQRPGTRHAVAHLENKVAHERFYTRTENGKRQQVKNPNYLRRSI